MLERFFFCIFLLSFFLSTVSRIRRHNQVVLNTNKVCVSQPKMTETQMICAVHRMWTKPRTFWLCHSYLYSLYHVKRRTTRVCCLFPGPIKSRLIFVWLLAWKKMVKKSLNLKYSQVRMWKTNHYSNLVSSIMYIGTPSVICLDVLKFKILQEQILSPTLSRSK